MQEVFERMVEKLDRASDHYECEEQGREDVYMVDLEEAIEIVKEAAAEYSNGWIPCSERLPEPKSKSFGSPQQRIEVIACKRNGVVKEMLYEFATKEFWEAGDCNPISRWKEDLYDSDCEIIAWQPLPEPYQQKED